MALFLISTDSDPFSTRVCNLDGTDYVLRMSYSQRTDSWCLGLEDLNGAVLLGDVAVVCNAGLIGPLHLAGLPPGEILALANPDGDTTPPGRLDLGEGLRVTLYYADASEGLRAKAS